MIRVCLKEAGLEYGDYFFCNSARCRIDKDNLSGKEITKILACCHDNAIAPINLLKPKAVILMGDFALRQVTKKSGITKHRGRWIYSKDFNCWFLPVFHPAYICRNMGLKKRLVDDFKMVSIFIQNKYRPPKLDEGRLKAYHELEDPSKLVKLWSKQKVAVGFDTESQGIDWLSPNFVFISYSLSPEKGKAYDVTLHEEVLKGKHDFIIQWPRRNGSKKQELVDVYVKRAENFGEKMQSLADFLFDPNIKKYMMHGNHDLHTIECGFKRAGLPIPKVNSYAMDIQAAANLVDENLYKMSSLDELQTSFTDVPEDYKADFQKKFDVTDMLAVPRNDKVIYANSDADVTRRAALSIKENLTQNGNERLGRYLVNFTMPALEFLRTLEINGALIDKKKLPNVTDDVYKSMIASEDRAVELIPTKVFDDFDLTESSIKKLRQDGKFLLTRDELVSEVLFGKCGFGVKGVKKTAGKERWSIDKESRIILLDRDIPKEAVDFIDAYDEFSDDHTMWSRYLKGFEKNIKPDGRIHSSYLLCVTVNGRVASRDPNMMNNPKRSKQAMRIRELICAPPGYVLMTADEAASELRWGTMLSHDEEFIRIFQNDLDPHAEVALLFLQRKDQTWTQERWNRLSKRDKELERRRGKASNFGLWYGQGLNGFIRFCKKEYGLDVSTAEANEWMSAWFGRFKRVREYQKNIVQFGLKHGYVESPLGRRRRLPDLRSRDDFVRGNAERMAMNTPISSPSSDTVILAGIEGGKNNPNPKYIRPTLFVHDELTFEVKESLIYKWAPILKEAMEHPPIERDFHYHMSVPLKAEINVGKNLADQHPI